MSYKVCSNCKDWHINADWDEIKPSQVCYTHADFACSQFKPNWPSEEYLKEKDRERRKWRDV